MEGSQRIGRIGLAGYPGYIFLQKIRYGYGHQRYDEKRTILHNWYSALRAYLPVIYRADDTSEMYKNKKEEYRETLLPLIDAVAKEIITARLWYRPSFENPEIYDPEEQTYEELLDGIKERLDDITAMTHIIDKGQMGETDDGEVFG